MGQAKVMAQSAKQKNGDGNGSGFWASLGFGNSADYNTTSFSVIEGYEDITGGGDIRKVEAYLDQASAFLCNIFQVRQTLYQVTPRLPAIREKLGNKYFCKVREKSLNSVINGETHAPLLFSFDE